MTQLHGREVDIMTEKL